MKTFNVGVSIYDTFQINAEDIEAASNMAEDEAVRAFDVDYAQVTIKDVKELYSNAAN